VAAHTFAWKGATASEVLVITEFAGVLKSGRKLMKPTLSTSVAEAENSSAFKYINKPGAFAAGAGPF
jgi:hypothetical protein